MPSSEKLLLMGSASDADSRVNPVALSGESTATREIRLANCRVLLVEDSLDNQNLFHRILTGAGALVTLASNGQQGVDISFTQPFDAIIMDIRMPILDGYEASKRIRASGYLGPIIALTAHATPGEEQRCRGAGCSHFQLKPIGRTGLLRAVFNALAINESSGVPAAP